MKENRSKRVLALALVLAMILTWIPLGAQAAATNLALGKTATASNVEAGTSFTASNVVDGNTSTSSRWATDQNVVEPYIEIDLGEETAIQQIDIYFERSDANQNILSYKVDFYADGAYETVYTKSERAAQHERITLDTAKNAAKVKLTVLDYDAGQNPAWRSVSVCEIELYAAATLTIGDIAKQVEATANTQIPVEVTNAAQLIPSIDGYTITINGADFEQIIAKDGTIHHPLTDKTVQVSFCVTDTTSSETVTTGDIPYIVKGQYTQDEANNPKPVVIPEIQEWYSDSTEKLSITSLTKITYDDAALKTVVDEFVADIQDLTGYTLPAVQGAAEANAINFSLEAPDALLGDEGYTMDIQTDRVNVQSVSTTGNMYAMQTILQICKQMINQNTAECGVGKMRDYPRFELRGLLLDIARKPISLDMVNEISRNMRYYKMNDLHVHLNDNYIWLEEYGTYANEDNGFNAYEAFRLESSLKNDAGESPTAEDYSISKADFRAFIQNQRALGMNIVPEIDVPAHAMAFTKVWPELSIDNQVASGHSLIDHFNLSLEGSYTKIKAIFDDYTKGDVPTFDSDTTVHVGADEYYVSATNYRQFFNTIIPYIKQTNDTVRVWGSLTMMNDNNQTQIVEEAIDGVQMNIWSAGWANYRSMYDMGFDLINTIDTYGYMVPNGGYGRGAYGDLLNLNSVFSSFKPNQIGDIVLPSGDDQVLGAAFAIWNDNIDRKASGLTESDIFYRFFDALPFYAEKTWAATGQEKGSAAALTELSQKMGTAPNTNPFYQVNSEGDTHLSYDFASMEDTSANDRNLIAGTAEISDGALVLNGGNSYVSTPIDKIGNGNELSFDITLTEAPAPGQILFEADPAYGTHDIRIMDDGRLGFTRELYSYYFDYTIPVNEKVNIRIAADQQETTLYVNGDLVGTATGKFIHNDTEKKTGITNATFAIPTERIGSKTNAVKAIIDNVVLIQVNTIDASDSSRDIPVSAMNATAGDYETAGGASEGPANLVLDNDINTLWHTDWYGTSRDNHWIQFELTEGYTVDGLRYKPRDGSVNGRILKYQVQTSEDGVAFSTVAEGTWKDNTNWKIANFEASNAKYVRLVSVDSKSDNPNYVFASAAEIRLTGEKAEVSAPEVTAFTADKNELTAEGGEITVTITGTNLKNGIDIKAGELTAKTSGTATEQTATLTIPANEAEEEVTYTIQYSLDGEDYTGEIKVTVAAAEKEDPKPSDPDDNDPKPSEPEDNDPKPSEPEDNDPKPSEPEEDEPKYELPECGMDEDCVLSQFSDVKIDDWYHDGVHFCVDHGIVNGMGNGTFAPNDPTTRAQLVTMLYRLEGEPSIEGLAEPFTDVSENDWFYAPIVWAYNNKVVNGMTETTFAPDAKITREQVATILHRYLGTPAGSGDLSGYPDADKVQDYAKDALTWAVGEGLINGVAQTDGTSLLAPDGNATRAQIATILMRYLTA